MMAHDILMFDSFKDKDESYFNLFKSKSALVRAQSKQVFFDHHWGPLSIKCTFQGEEEYFIRNRRYKVNRDQFLLVNEGTWYSSAIQNSGSTESFSIFFSPAVVKACLAAHCENAESGIDDPFHIIHPDTKFIEKLFTPSGRTAETIGYLRHLSFRFEENSFQIEELLHRLFDEILMEQTRCYSEINSIPGIKKSTRLELYRRLNYAKDYMKSNYQEQMGLKKLSQLAMLSPEYFLRAFKKVYGTTPYQFLLDVRLNRAKEMILANEMVSITEVSSLVGWYDLASFSKSFKRKFGCSPINSK